MKPSFLKPCLAGLLFFFFSHASFADMYVDRSIVIFEPDGPPREDVKVSNTGDEVIYVQVDVFSVDNAGSEQEKLSKVTDPKNLKLIATPNKMVIPAGGQKLIRIVNLEASNEEERIYRINVTPIVAPLSEETSQLRIVVAYQILTIIQPDSPTATLVAQRDGKMVTFRNDGNSNILLSEGNQCKSPGSTDCNELPSHRLYAGNSWNLDLPYDAPLTYSMRTFDGIKKQLVE
jgi:P pilus assembly chaperone PapD